MTTITLDYPPSANRYWRMANNRLYPSQSAVVYKAVTALICRTAGIEPADGDVAITMRLYRPAKRGDLDNRIKVLLDALQGYAYHNDSQIAEIHATRHEDKVTPRVEVEIRHLEGI